MTELNPNNPITQQMHDNWHKVVALLMADYGIHEFEITAQIETNAANLVERLRALASAGSAAGTPGDETER